ncbi:TPA: small toxic inner membrane protein TimP [Salmonella enterica]|nr:small toxic inner membrane protein TimP [Salmonella enterica]
MKRYFCIVIVVSGALLSSGNGGWSISNNSITVTINAAGK